MKIIDTYNNYKEKYKEYVLVIKSGIFYECLNDDIAVMYSLFHYKIKNNGNSYYVGFPQNNIVKVTDILKQNKINYIVLDKISDNYEVIDKFKSNKNMYSNYYIDPMKINYILYKINNINDKLISKMYENNIEKTLIQIEELL